jgi:hypothetical protein
MTWIDRGIGWFWARVAASTTPVTEGLGFLRVLTGLFFMLIVPPYAYWVGTSPPAFFNPPRISAMALLSGFPSTPVMWLADIAAFACACCLLLGVYARASSLLLTVIGVLSSNATMCFGKIDHDAMLWTFLGCMAFSGWGRSLALRPDKPSRWDNPEKAFALMAVCLAFGMTVIGVHKALGWLDFDLKTNGFLGWFVHGYFVDGRTDLLADLVPRIPPLGLELMDYSGVVFEGGCFVALLLGRRVWRIWVLAACLFHLTNILTLNIPFLQNLLIYLAFVDFSAVQRKLEPWLQARAVRIAAVVVGVGMVLAHLLLRRAGIGRWLLFVFDENHDNPFVLRFSAVVYVVAFAVVARDLARRWRLPRAAAEPASAEPAVSQA